MIDLGLGELDSAITDALGRVLGDAKTPGWTVNDQGVCALDTALWRGLTDLTVTDADAGEEGPTLLTAELAAEMLGEALVGLPLIDHLVVLRLLDGAGARDAREAVLASGEPAALLTPAVQAAPDQPPLCLGGAIARHIVRLSAAGDIDLLEVGSDRPAYAPNLGDLPVARIETRSGWTSIARGRADLAAIAAAERKTLVSGAIAGLGRKAITLAVDYANTRELFGAPIGAFQSLAHSLSTAKVHTDGAELLARQAAWARDADPQDFDRTSRMAYAFASRAGDIATRTAVHIFGGYGVTREYPAQSYFRAARTLSLFIGDHRLELRAIGQGLLREAAA